ncbi:16114_t:CDS:2, partial [Dentiscutata heterogama]
YPPNQEEIYFNNLYPSLKNEYSSLALPVVFSQDTIISESSEYFSASESPTNELEVLKNNVNILEEDSLTMIELKKISDKINALDFSNIIPPFLFLHSSELSSELSLVLGSENSTGNHVESLYSSSSLAARFSNPTSITCNGWLLVVSVICS